jgi:Domain of unknown function (DUF6484)
MTVPSKPRRSRKTALPTSVVCGRVVGLDCEGQLTVDFPGNQLGPLTARSVVVPEPEFVGRQAIVAFDGGDQSRPIVLGIVRDPAIDRTIKVTVDGERVTLCADREFVLCCGEASVTLTRAGKIILRGAYVLSRSSGVNAVKGASVQIN